MPTHQIKELIISMAREHLQGKISSNNNIKFCFNIRDSVSTQYTYALVQAQGGGASYQTHLEWEKLVQCSGRN